MFLFTPQAIDNFAFEYLYGLLSSLSRGNIVFVIKLQKQLFSKITLVKYTWLKCNLDMNL